MTRINFLYAEVKVYPASVEEDSIGYKWDSLLIAKEPVLTTYKNIGLSNYYPVGLYGALDKWIDKETIRQGRELLLQHCPKAPGE